LLCDLGIVINYQNPRLHRFTWEQRPYRVLINRREL
jgi:hypothetical protein